MLVIIKYGSEFPEREPEILEKGKIDFKISNKESDITKATHIILPDTGTITTAIRKMQMMNLYSLLRMKNIPMLGINNGAVLMCNYIADVNKPGLGFFKIKVNSLSEENGEKAGELKIKKQTGLLKDVDEQKVVLTKQNFIADSMFTTSIVVAGKEEFSFTLESGNHFGLQADLEKNENLSKKIIMNFLAL